MYRTEHRMPQTFKVGEGYFEHIQSEWKLRATAMPNSKFDSFVGQGSSGVVLSGKWFGKKAAFKFIEIGMKNWLELTSIQAAKGSKILEFYGHYR